MFFDAATDDPSALGDLVLGHKWLAATAVVVGVATRLLKSDTKIPINVPPRARVWLALGLGAASSVLDMIVAGAPWQKAVTDGFVGVLLAVLGHDAVIGSIRSGKEIPVPGLMVPGASPSPGAPPTVPPRVDPGQRDLAERSERDTDPPPPVDPTRPAA